MLHFNWKNIAIIFHVPGKTFLKMSKSVREICVLVKEKVRELFSDFGGNPGRCPRLSERGLPCFVVQFGVQ